MIFFIDYLERLKGYRFYYPSRIPQTIENKARFLCLVEVEDLEALSLKKDS